MRISKRAEKIKSFIAMDVLERVQKMQRAGENVISLSIGEPDLAPPKAAVLACAKALEAGLTQYTHSQGLEALREAICLHYLDRYRVNIEPDQILVTAGSSPAFFLVFSVLLNAGDQVILPSLTYPCYPNFIEFFDGQIAEVPVDSQNAFQYQAEDLKKKISKNTQAILLNSPSNPTGYLIPKETLKDLANLKPWLVSDEIYHGLVYDNTEHSILEFTDRAFVINGFSKAYAMTGFRLGYVIAPKAFVRALQKVQQNFSISVNTFVQHAGVAALKDGQEDQKKICEIFRERRAVAWEALKKIGLAPKKQPEGAFYMLVDLKKYTSDSYRFVLDCLETMKVGFTPGIDFGRSGEGYLRISYANSKENIEEGIRRLGCFLENYRE